MYNFNNYYKFMCDSIIDNLNRNPDAVATNNANAVSQAYIHIDQHDPESDRKFTETRVDPNTNKVIEVDITDKVLYVNAATGVMFIYNTCHKNDPTFGYGLRAPGWIPFAGAVTK